MKNNYFTNNSDVYNQDVNTPAYLDNIAFTLNNQPSNIRQFITVKQCMLQVLPSVTIQVITAVRQITGQYILQVLLIVTIRPVTAVDI